MKQQTIMSLSLAMMLCFFLTPAASADPGEPFLGVLLQELDDELLEHF